MCKSRSRVAIKAHLQEWRRSDGAPAGYRQVGLFFAHEMAPEVVGGKAGDPVRMFTACRVAAASVCNAHMAAMRIRDRR